MGKFIDLTGKVFGRLTVIRKSSSSIYRKTIWQCKCECGKYADVVGESLKQGHTKSCGCLAREALVKRNTIHGNATRSHKSRTYETWRGMIARCEDPLNKRYNNYHSKGITVCEEWHNFNVFLESMGERPEGLTLDRKDNSKGYYKDNCRWATVYEQANNRSNNNLQTYNGITMTMMQWSKYLAIDRSTIARRMKDGWSFEYTAEYYENKKVTA